MRKQYISFVFGSCVGRLGGRIFDHSTQIKPSGPEYEDSIDEEDGCGRILAELLVGKFYAHC